MTNIDIEISGFKIRNNVTCQHTFFIFIAILHSSNKFNKTDTFLSDPLRKKEELKFIMPDSNLIIVYHFRSIRSVQSPA